MNRVIRHIVILQLSGIGNFVMLTPTIMNLRRLFPEARITLLVEDNGASHVLEGLPTLTFRLIDPLMLRRPMGLLKYGVSLRRDPVDLFLLAYPSQEFYGAALAWLAGAHIRVGHSYRVLRRKGVTRLLTHALPLDETLHEVERNLGLLRTLHLNPAPVYPHFHLDEVHRQWAVELLQGFDALSAPLVGMHFHPRASRRWPVRHFVTVANWLISRFQSKIILLGAQEEVELAAKFLAQVELPHKVINLVGTTTLNEAAALVEKCSLFVSDDSGLMHVATAVRTPVVAVFGPTDPVKNAPYTANGMAVVVKADHHCSPCYRIGKGLECSQRTCLLDLSPVRVKAAVQELLASLSSPDK